MNNSFTKGFFGRKLITGSLTLILLLFAQFAKAHRVEAFTTSGCAAGQNVTIDASISNAPSITWYSWQYKDATGIWKCFVNGANTINGVSFTVSGAKAQNIADNAPLLTINNATTALENVLIRVLMREGAEPCGAPAGTVWGGDDLGLNEVKMLRLHIYTPSGDCGGTTPGCIGNVLSNASGYYGGFENKVYNASTISFTDNNFVAGAGSTQYTISQPTLSLPVPSGSGTAQIWNNPYTMNTGNGKFAPLTGNYQMIIQGSANVQRKAWFKTVTVTPGNTYGFSVWVARTQGSNAFNLKLTANGVDITSGAVSTTVGSWNQVSGSYTVPTGVTSIEISISDVSTAAERYFSLDDICFRQTASGATGSIGDRVWFDADGDGIQDATETGGLTGITVQLRNSAGSVIATTNTNGSGNYIFTGLAAGTYTVAFPVSISGAVVTGQNVGADDNVDSDPSQTTGITGNIVLATGQNITNVDAGYCPTTLELGNRVWDDVNNDGLNGSENGIANVTVNLYKDDNNDNVADGAAIATLTTDANGYYSFTNLGPGNYIVGVVTPAGYTSSAVNGGDPDNNINLDDNGQVTVGNETRGLAITLVAGTEPDGTNTNTNNNITYDFGFYAPKVNLGNLVYIDRNDNGKYETSLGDFGIDGITVVLYADNDDNGIADGAAVATTTTAGGGIYSFTNLLAGKYFVQLQNLPSWAFMTTVNAGDPDNDIDNDNNGLTHNVAGGIIKGGTITLTAGGEPDAAVDGDGTSGNKTYDMGLFKTNGLGDFVWVDSDGDGAQDAGEPGIANVTVRLKNTAGTVLATTTTDGNGMYFFYDPAQYGTNNYIIEFVTPAGYVATTSNAGGDDTKDSDPVNGQITGVTVPAGVWNHTFDAGFVQPASLGDRVWKDDNGNGIQDPGEVGVAGVTLVLLDAAGNVVATTTTDALGNYKFSNLKPGNYTVRVTPPANYSLSPKSQGGNTNTDSDFDPNTFVTSTVTLLSGQNRTDIDAGLKFSQPQTASVGDRVWLDTDGDGVQDAGEPGVSNVLVTLYNNAGVAVRSTYTDVNGNYLFTDVVPGSYTVGFTLPPAMVFSPNNGAVSVADNSDVNPATGRTASFTVNAGDQITYVDAGIKTQLVTNGSVGDFVWNDLDKDGFQDAGEPGIPNVTVRLINANTNAVIATTTTDAVGKYIFNDVAPGDYQVEFVTPAGYTTTTKLVNNPVSSGTDSDANTAAGGKTGVFSLGSGQRITTVDAGYWLTTAPGTAKLGDRVWYDVNQNGVQDANEPSVPGITVVLYNGAGTAIAQTVTDQNGNYFFTDLAAGTYSVGFSNLPTGFTFTSQGLGTAATGSDANPSTGRTAAVTLVAGQVNLDVDAGIKQAQAGTASLGNKVWYDLNNNGLQNAGELGVQGVFVELLDAAGNAVDRDLITPGVQPATATTNALGEYLFTGLQAGDYRVRFSNLPAGYAPVTKNAGTNRDIDSDGNALAAGSSTTDVVGLSINQERLDIDLGIFNTTAPLGQLGDRVWFDTNNNGVQDAVEAGVPGVSVALLDAAGNTIRTTVTDKDGSYKFINLPDATYSVQFSNLPAGFVFSPRDQVAGGGNDTNDSDADPATGKTGTYTIIGGSSNMTVDAGIFSTRAALGDYVWYDSDADGIQDATESGIPGVTVTLYDAAGNAVASTITDQSGRYFFSNLNAGNYTVGFTTIPQQLAFTVRDNVTAGDAADSDVDPATGRTGTIALAAGQVNLTVDAGLKPFIPASVGDFVWNDRNADGIQTAGEPGVAGVIVTLFNSANLPIGSAVTDGNGFYLITNVPPGNGYYLVFSNKPGANSPWTTKDVLTGGGTVNNNSKVNSGGTTDLFNVTEGQNIRNMDAGIVLPSSVPIRLLSFTGQLNGNNNALLQWSTSQEQGTSHFDVERSLDGLNFIKTGNSVTARGISSVRSDYNFNDNLTGISASKVYYRLKVVDRNGMIEYTNVVIIRLADVKITSVYPNPFSDIIRIETDNKVREKAIINLYDVTGKVVMSKQQTVEVGGNLITITGVQQLPQGTYTLTLTTDSGEHFAQKLIKK